MEFYIPRAGLPAGYVLEGETLTKDSELMDFSVRVDDHETYCRLTLDIPLNGQDEFGATEEPKRLLVCARRVVDGVTRRYMYCVELPGEIDYDQSEIDVVRDMVVILKLKKKNPELWNLFGKAPVSEHWGWTKVHTLALYDEGSRPEWTPKEERACCSSSDK